MATTNNAIDTLVITLGGSFTMSGAYTFTGTLTGNTSVTFPTSGTLLSTVFGVLPLIQGGTSAPLTAANGGILYSTATSLAILVPTATANQVLLSGSNTTPAWSTAVYPPTTVVSQLLYSSATNTIAGLSTANNGLLVTSNTGVPSILAGPGTTGQVLQANAAAAPSFSTASYPSTTTVSQILYSSGTNVVAGLATGNNGVLVTGAGGIPAISSTIPSATQDNITRLGTIVVGVWNGTLLTGTYGGTGVNNSTRLITVAGNFTTTGAFNPTLAFSASNTYTFPAASQTMLGLAGGSLTAPLYLVNSTPATSLEAASKGYVDSIASGFSIIAAARAATTANLAGYVYANGVAGVGATLTAGGVGVLTLDGIATVLNDRLLIKNQSTTFQNGVYYVSTEGTAGVAAILTRVTDYDTSAEIVPGTIVPVTSGTTLASSSWLQYNTVTTMGTDPIQFSQFSVSFPVLLAQGGTSGNLTASAGSITYSTASAMAFTAVGAAGQLLASAGTGTPIWTTSTYPASAGTVGKIIISDGTNFITSTPTYPNASVTAGKFIISDGTNYIASTSIMPNTVGTALHLLISDGTSNVYSTPAYPNASVTAGKIIISDGTNYIASTSIFPNTVGANGKILISDGTSNVYSTPTYPNASATAGKIIISDGTNFVASTSLFPNTVGTVGKILRSDGSVNAYTTATFADTYTGLSLLYASSANVVVGLASPSSAILSTDVTGVPTWISEVQVPNGGTGAASFTAWGVICGGTTTTGALQSVPSLGLAGQVLTSQGNSSLPQWTSVSGTGTVNAGTAGQLAYYAGAGTTLSGGQLGNVKGTATNDNAAAGNVGEFIESNISYNVGPAMTSGVELNVTSLSLTAGDYDLWGNVTIAPTGTITSIVGWISTTSATFPDISLTTFLGTNTGNAGSIPVPFKRISISVTTTVYLTIRCTFSGTANSGGYIAARRVR